MKIDNEVLELLDAISDKVMETGILTKCINEGSLNLVEITIKGDKECFDIIINLDLIDRVDDLTLDEDDIVCDRINDYFDEKGFKEMLANLGYDFNQGFNGFLAYKI